MRFVAGLAYRDRRCGTSVDRLVVREGGDLGMPLLGCLRRPADEGLGARHGVRSAGASPGRLPASSSSGRAAGKLPAYRFAALRSDSARRLPPSLLRKPAAHTYGRAPKPSSTRLTAGHAGDAGLTAVCGMARTQRIAQAVGGVA